MSKPLPSLQDKTVLVTGATSGIGEAAARKLASLGAHTILVGRNRKKCEAVAQNLIRASNNRNIDVFQADLSSQSEIRGLAAELISHVDKLDVLVNNAGALFKTRKQSIDGLELTFALNHLGYFLLTVLLLPALRKSPSGRIVVVGSHAHEGARMDFDDLQLEHGYERINAYRQSKLANLLFTFELARLLRGEHITVNALTPGNVATNLGRNNGALKTTMRNLVGLLRGSMLTAGVGAGTVVYLAASPEVEGVTGHYFREERPISPSSSALDSEAARRLWEVSERLTGMDTLLVTGCPPDRLG
jgi:NAD(P)-dependent dehydrogenase (short-subunit alcohol dehydrogenase family)